MATQGEKLALSMMLAVGAIGFGTYGHVWQETRGANGAINGVELIRDDEVNADSTIVESITIDPSNKTQIKQSLIQKALDDPWCSTSYIAVKTEDLLVTNNEDNRNSQQSDAVVNVQVCLDPQSIDIRDGYMMAFFTTNPPLKTGEGHPSIYLTYEQDVLIPQCKTAKEEMRKQLESDLVTILGVTAAQNFQTELHVNKDYMGHPCDDLFIDP